MRSRIVLRCVDGLSNKEVAARERVSQPTVGKWRQRFMELRVGRPLRRSASGAAAVDQVEQVVVDTLESTPAHATHWSRRKKAAKSGVWAPAVGRIWRAFEFKPHRTDGFKLPPTRLFIAAPDDNPLTPQSWSGLADEAARVGD